MTNSPDVVVTDKLIKYTAETAGDEGLGWLRELPAIAASLMHRFEVRLGYVHPESNRSLLLVVRTRDDRPAALKIERQASAQVPALAAFASAGVGPEILDRAPEHNAVLMAWSAGVGMDDEAVDARATMCTVSTVLAGLIPPADLGNVPSAVEETLRGIEVARRRLTESGLEPFDPRLFDVDADKAEWNAGVRLLHGDLVPKNVLTDEAGGVCLIDPEPALGAIEFDLANLAGRYRRGTGWRQLIAAAREAAPGLDQALLNWNVHRAARTYVAYQIAMGREVGAAFLECSRVSGVEPSKTRPV